MCRRVNNSMTQLLRLMPNFKTYIHVGCNVKLFVHGSLGLPNLIPRERVSDCFEIHKTQLSLCSLLLTSHNNFLLVGGLHLRVFAIPVSLWN